MKDYRGVRVFSAFSRFSILDTHWYILAEIDESEVLTNHYLTYIDALRKPLLNRLTQSKTHIDPKPHPIRALIKVDMGEYQFTKAGRQLGTRGIASCTGVAVTFPGRFAYLAHVAPTDETYASAPIDLFDQSEKTDLLTNLLDRIRQYEIYPYEIDSLQIALVATHDESCWKIIEQLVAFGISIDKIKLLYNPEAEYANMWIDENATNVTVEWTMNNNRSALAQNSGTTTDLGELVKEWSLN